MRERILVTGGAGFIGSHLVDALVERGYRVRILDNLAPQVHGADQAIPDYLNQDAEFMLGDVRDRDAVRKAIEGVDVIFHEAAAVGVGQSMYEVHRYMDANTLGTAMLLDVLVNEKHRVSKLMVASSMSIYGEGKYACAACGEVYPRLRTKEQLREGKWEMLCPTCNRVVEPLPTDELKPLYPTSIYAISKRDQEELCLNVGQAYGISTVALRYFNTYGIRQALSNPYTGVAAIFSSRILNGNAPLIFEDGLQSRDFVHVSDIVQANLRALEHEQEICDAFNVGTGRSLTIRDVADKLRLYLDRQDLELEVVEKFREGDIRHCYADIHKIETVLGFKPRVSFEDGMQELAEWVKQQEAVDMVDKAYGELRAHGLTV